ncbi:hypothetical protein J7E87_30410 [Streptomyces sp. ISL-1]|uniref:hypothetical protein n=1 Tax=Streptomyces sp. ISL-1 TaxID=2817657 RepID=UPI001BEC02F7|nr:hypothetical protein [Streptomyces sp. ISL-1]MBT2393607.1 hypothetical protein [Streptomyces sp. ISL-1]
MTDLLTAQARIPDASTTRATSINPTSPPADTHRAADAGAVRGSGRGSDSGVVTTEARPGGPALMQSWL